VGEEREKKKTPPPKFVLCIWKFVPLAII
jgi:hypothetical protein